MRGKVRALVVEDDLKIQEEIEDTLCTLGHDHDWAESQQDARELLEQNQYDYVLVDLQIPARTGRGFAKIEHGRNLVEQIQRIKGRGMMPAIIMTGYAKEGLNLAVELLGNGAMEFISKPFGDAASGKSLPQVIQNVLEKHRHAFPPGKLPGDPPKDFRGGVLAFYPDHIELCGEIILESDGPGHAWEMMQVLRAPRANGKLTNFSAPKLAKAVDPTGQLSDGAIASCVHDVRVRISNTMLEKTNVTVGREDVIANKNRGYHIAAWLRIESHDDVTHTATAGYDGAIPPSPTSRKASLPAPAGDTPLTSRQHWILAQLRDAVKLTRAMVEEQFGIKEKQAKRELAGLSSRGLIEFIRRPRPGYYVLRSKSRPKAGV